MNWAEPDKNVSPIWTSLLSKGLTSPGEFKEKPSNFFSGFGGQGLLSGVIDPWINSKMPDKWNLDLEGEKISYNPTSNLNMFYKNKNKGFKAGLNWRF